LLAYFLRNPSRAISRDELLDNVWNEPAHFSSRTVDVLSRRLRRKLGPELDLTTVRGFGSRLDGWDAAVSSGTG
jgi:DNA-binding response OmpR family regulator